jgi:hypothetical protein
MCSNAKSVKAALRVCLLFLLAATLFAAAGCRTHSYRDLQWDDVSGRKRDNAALDADYEKCRTVRDEALLRAESSSRTTPDMPARASSDTAFLSCMERAGWKPRRRAG